LKSRPTPGAMVVATERYDFGRYANKCCGPDMIEIGGVVARLGIGKVRSGVGR
jgi:hypothetical protein